MGSRVWSLQAKTALSRYGAYMQPVRRPKVRKLLSCTCCDCLILSIAFWVARSTTRFRTQIPSHASWSADGSLLVVSLGAYVVLYDPSTMLAMKTLTFPECPLILSAHFVGRGGRYLALRGPRDLILWDVVTESGTFHLLHRLRCLADITLVIQFVGITTPPRASAKYSRTTEKTPSSSSNHTA